MQNNTTQGFTLIELLIVIAIIGILAAVLIPNLLQARERANESATQSYVRNCITAIEANRDPVEQTLPEVETCEADPLGMSLPAAVTSSTVNIDEATDSYTVSAVAANGTTYTYAGEQIERTEATE